MFQSAALLGAGSGDVVVHPGAVWLGQKRVRTIPVDRGQETVIWDGRNDAGLSLPSGTYFYRFVHATGSTEPRKAIHIR